MRDKAYLTGLILIGLTFLTCVISFWLLYYGIFIFAVGALLVSFSTRPIKTKLLTIILPIVIYLPATFLFLLAYNYTAPKTFLIPAGYEGQIRIVYEQECGIKLQKENGKRILQFPDNGILVLNEKFDGGNNNEYYLVDKNGRRTKVEESLYPATNSINPPYVSIGGAGTLGVGSDNEIKFSDFYLYNKDTTRSGDFREEQRFDSLTTAIVRACRAN